MEGIAAGGYHGVRTYWKRRRYHKLNGMGSRRKPPATVELGATDGSTRRRRRFWRIRLAPRLKLKLRFSPKRFMIALRDAYVNFMNKIANSRLVSSGGYAINGFGVRPLKEYDERMLIEIYKSLVVAQPPLVPAPRVPNPHPTPPLATIAEC